MCPVDGHLVHERSSTVIADWPAMRDEVGKNVGIDNAVAQIRFIPPEPLLVDRVVVSAAHNHVVAIQVGRFRDHIVDRIGGIGWRRKRGVQCSHGLSSGVSAIPCSAILAVAVVILAAISFSAFLSAATLAAIVAA